MTAIALDFDAPDHAMTPAWAAETQAKIEALLAAHRGGFGYMTKNGARVVWAIEPVAISDAESACNWSRRYLSFVAYLRRCWQLEADALHDHTRLFRLPFVVRDGVAQRPLTIGDPRAIGALDWAPTAEDEAAAAEAWPRIFDGTSTPPLCGTDQPPASRPQRIEGSVTATRGVLYDLLARRGDIRSPHDLGDGSEAFHVRCPRADRHSPGTGDDALLIASHGGGPGWITCRHNGCAGLEPADWLALLGVTQRVGKVARWFINAAPRGVGIRLALDLLPEDRGAPMPYVRVSSGTPAWSALWRAADVEAPSDLDHDGDLGDALRELRGRRLLIESDNGRTRRILTAPARERVAA